MHAVDLQIQRALLLLELLEEEGGERCWETGDEFNRERPLTKKFGVGKSFPEQDF